MTYQQRRISPAGRPIYIRQQMHETPAWVARRRRAYRLIDAIAENGKRAVRKFVPRPGRGIPQITNCAPLRRAPGVPLVGRPSLRSGR
jgi:hypothetical protein